VINKMEVINVNKLAIVKAVVASAMISAIVLLVAMHNPLVIAYAVLFGVLVMLFYVYLSEKR